MAFVILTGVVCGVFNKLFMENMYFTPFAFEVYDFQEGGNFLERITNILMTTKLKYGIKDGITGIRKHRFAKMPLRESKMTQFEIDDMLQRIANRRIDPLHYFPANYVPAVTVYFKEDMIG